MERVPCWGPPPRGAQQLHGSRNGSETRSCALALNGRGDPSPFALALRAAALPVHQPPLSAWGSPSLLRKRQARGKGAGLWPGVPPQLSPPRGAFRPPQIPAGLFLGSGDVTAPPADPAQAPPPLRRSCRQREDLAAAERTGRRRPRAMSRRHGEREAGQGELGAGAGGGGGGCRNSQRWVGGGRAHSEEGEGDLPRSQLRH